MDASWRHVEKMLPSSQSLIVLKLGPRSILHPDVLLVLADLSVEVVLFLQEFILNLVK